MNTNLVMPFQTDLHDAGLNRLATDGQIDEVLRLIDDEEIYFKVI